MCQDKLLVCWSSQDKLLVLVMICLNLPPVCELIFGYILDISLDLLVSWSSQDKLLVLVMISLNFPQVCELIFGYILDISLDWLPLCWGNGFPSVGAITDNYHGCMLIEAGFLCGKESL